MECKYVPCNVNEATGGQVKVCLLSHDHTIIFPPITFFASHSFVLMAQKCLEIQIDQTKLICSGMTEHNVAPKVGDCRIKIEMTFCSVVHKHVFKMHIKLASSNQLLYLQCFVYVDINLNVNLCCLNRKREILLNYLWSSVSSKGEIRKCPV